MTKKYTRYRSGNVRAIGGRFPQPIHFKRRRPAVGAPLGARPRMGMGYSRTLTKTQTRKKRKRMQTVRASLNGSDSYCTHGSRRTRSFLQKKVLHRSTISSINPSAATSGVGKQQVTQFSMLNRDDLIAMRTAVNLGVATEGAMKLFMYQSKQKIHLRNQHNSLVTALIYDITTKSRPSSSILDTPAEAWERGFIDSGLLAGHSLNVHQTPSFSAEFRMLFKIQKVTKVLLEAGQQHEHTVRQNVNRLVDTTVIGNASLVSLPGFTSWVMVVHYGGLAHETATPASVTFTSSTLDFVQFKADTYGAVPNALPTYTLTNNLAFTALNLDFMGENQDADIDPSNA